VWLFPVTAVVVPRKRGDAMIGVMFDKNKAEYFLDCIGSGKPIACVWNVHNMLALAGALHFAAMSHGPAALRQGVEVGELPAEHREAIEEGFYDDLRAAIEFYSRLTMMVKDGEYDESFHPTLKAIATIRDGKKRVQIVAGAKQ
jgi:hypothetical protein